MITLNSIIHGDKDHFRLDYSDVEHPITIQLGGSNPKDFITCGKIAEELGYDEININVGCPSERVKKGNFGLSLMSEPDLIADCIKAMKDTLNIPVSVKCRTGYDNNDSYEELHNFIDKQVRADVDFICIHARKGWLNGLSPKENRTIPELDYQSVYDIKKDFPNTQIGINGGIKTIAESIDHLQHIDSVMIGREAYYNPMILSQVDNHIYNVDNSDILHSPMDVAHKMAEYIHEQMSIDSRIRLHNITRHCMNLFHNLRNARAYRRYLSDHSTKKDANVDTFMKSLEVFD